MTQSAAVDTDRIDGTPRTVRELFTSRKYGLDYYQREYGWSEANVAELLDDLASAFRDEWDEEHERRQVAGYRPYFLGPIVTTARDGLLYLVDGQQRLTTLTLLLVHLRHLLSEHPDTEDLTPLVASHKYGEYTFNLAVEEREPCLSAALEGRDFDPIDASESVRTLWRRYLDIERLFPEELAGRPLLHFVDWLLERVVVVEIRTDDQDLALEIFETMNDRGQRLSSTDMLKSYLLSNIRDDGEVARANALWRERTTALADAERNADAAFFRDWLRAKFAESIRERRRDAAPGDFDVIGTAFHKWVRDNREEIGLRKPGDFTTFVTRDFDRMSRRYLRLLEASSTLTPGLEPVFYNASTGFTLQFQTILAAVTPVDDDETFERKARMVAGYLDRLVVLRMINYRNFGYSTVSYTLFNLAREIRDLPVEELSDALGERVASTEETFDGALTFGLNQRNRGHTRYLLARLTAWVEEQCGTGLRFAEYIDRGRSKPFEIEHVWADHPERHRDEFDNDAAFAERRDRFGGLLLLPKDFNASYGDLPYRDKLPHYLGQNLLARSLHPRCYEHNPSFTAFVARTGLPFKPYPDGFPSAAIDERQALYRDLCEYVWTPSGFDVDAPVPQSPSPADDSDRGRRAYSATLLDLLRAGLVRAGDHLTGTHLGREHRATVTGEGYIRLDDGAVHRTPSAAAMATLNRQSWNGWAWWRVERDDGSVLLSRLRERLLDHRDGFA